MKSNPTTSSTTECDGSPARFWRLGLAALCLLGVVGCMPRAGAEVDASYGGARGSSGGPSVAGTGALAKMFESAGWSSYTWNRLSPWLEKHEVIVWAPDDFQPPTSAQRQWLSTWLIRGNRQRTLIYIARDFDAASAYWKAIRPGSPPSQARELARRHAQAQADFAAERAAIPDKNDAGWFTTDTSQSIRRVTKLAGAWAQGIDPAKTDIEIGTRLRYDQVTGEVEELLVSEGDVLVASQIQGIPGDLPYNPYSGRGELLVVANGSFLLNAQLVNKEHRKLAGRLIQHCGKPGSVVFLESDSRGLPISDKDATETSRSPFDMLDAFPMGLILLHAACAGLVACAWLYPIFGNPKALRPATRTDFGQHVKAVGALMARNQNTDYAEQQLAAYHQQVPKQSPRAASGRALPTRRKRAAPVAVPAKTPNAKTEN